MKKQLIIVLLIFFIVACSSTPSQIERNNLAQQLTSQHGWAKSALETDHFILQAFLPTVLNKAKTLTIYLEGDGLAWVNASTPSINPTPINPLALKLAVLDTNPAVYLARPCQYVEEHQSKNCIQKFWTSHRFSPEVIVSTNQAIDQIKHKFGAQKLILVGYSGGAAVAALAAAKRNDVVKLVTVAGNLDHAHWAKQHHLSPLSGSLNPADAWLHLQEIPQHHYVGGRDSIIDEDIALSYAKQFKTKINIDISVLPTFDHHCCWESIWPSIVKNHFGDLQAIEP